MLSNQEIGSRIFNTRQSKGLTLDDIALSVGVAKSTIQRYEKGAIQKIKLPVLESIANALGVNPNWLIGNVDDPVPPEAQREFPYNPTLRIPVLGTIPAGIPLEAIEDIVDWEEIPAEWSQGGKEYFALEVKGNSMYPEFLPKDRVIVRKTDGCHSGDVCVVRVNGSDATLKRIEIGEDHTLSTIPSNPQYPPRTYSVEEIENLPVSIAGVVVEMRRKV